MHHFSSYLMPTLSGQVEGAEITEVSASLSSESCRPDDPDADDMMSGRMTY